jgi:hypothetical protein
MHFIDTLSYLYLYNNEQLGVIQCKGKRRLRTSMCTRQQRIIKRIAGICFTDRGTVQGKSCFGIIVHTQNSFRVGLCS